MDDKVKQSKEDANHIPSTGKALSRREALERLAKLGVYSAPTVTTLMSAQLSHAAGSLPPGNNNCTGNGAHLYPGADDPGTNDNNGRVDNNNFTDFLRVVFGGRGDRQLSNFNNNTSADC